jgi:hypothetical protein
MKIYQRWFFLFKKTYDPSFDIKCLNLKSSLGVGLKLVLQIIKSWFEFWHIALKPKTYKSNVKIRSNSMYIIHVS